MITHLDALVSSSSTDTIAGPLASAVEAIDVGGAGRGHPAIIGRGAVHPHAFGLCRKARAEREGVEGRVDQRRGEQSTDDTEIGAVNSRGQDASNGDSIGSAVEGRVSASSGAGIGGHGRPLAALLEVRRTAAQFNDAARAAAVAVVGIFAACSQAEIAIVAAAALVGAHAPPLSSSVLCSSDPTAASYPAAVGTYTSSCEGEVDARSARLAPPPCPPPSFVESNTCHPYSSTAVTSSTAAAVFAFLTCLPLNAMTAASFASVAAEFAAEAADAISDMATACAAAGTAVAETDIEGGIINNGDVYGSVTSLGIGGGEGSSSIGGSGGGGTAESGDGTTDDVWQIANFRSRAEVRAQANIHLAARSVLRTAREATDLGRAGASLTRFVSDVVAATAGAVRGTPLVNSTSQGVMVASVRIGSNAASGVHGGGGGYDNVVDSEASAQTSPHSCAATVNANLLAVDAAPLPRDDSTAAIAPRSLLLFPPTLYSYTSYSIC